MSASLPDIWSGGHVPIIGVQTDQTLTVPGGQDINFNVEVYWDPNPSHLGYSAFKMELSQNPFGATDPPGEHDVPGVERADTFKLLDYYPLNQYHLPIPVVIPTTDPPVTTNIYRRLVGYRGNKVVGKWAYTNKIILVSSIVPPVVPEDKVFKVFFDEVIPPENIVVYLKLGRLRAEEGSLQLMTSNHPSGPADPPGPTAGVAPKDWTQHIEAWKHSSWTRVVIRTAPTNNAVPVYFTLRWRSGSKTRSITSKFAVTARPK